MRSFVDEDWDKSEALELVRLKVPGGWIVFSSDSNGDENHPASAMSESMAFLPDPKYSWDWKK
jgi:hypothetical protein